MTKIVSTIHPLKYLKFSHKKLQKANMRMHKLAPSVLRKGIALSILSSINSYPKKNTIEKI